MKNILLLIIFLYPCDVFCQKDTIDVQKTFGGYRYMKNGQKLNSKELLNTLSIYPLAFNEAKVAKSNSICANILAFSGGILVGWYIGSQINGQSNDNQVGLLAAGGGLIGISIPLSLKSNKKMKTAVDLYNKRLD
jgi:hypothetical protein